MSDTPPSDPRDDRVSGAAPEPFVRGRIVWGRPPETVFRAGPLPRAPQAWGQPAPRPATPTRPAGNIFTGSMIPPRAAPAAEPLLPGERPLVADTGTVAEGPEPVAAKPRRARKAAVIPEPAPTPDVADAPVVEAYSEPAPEATPEPNDEPVSGPVPEAVVETIVEPEPVRPTSPPRPTVEIIVEPEAPEQIDTLPPPLSSATTGPADPRAMPSVVVTPTLYARVEAVIEKVKTNDTWRIAAVAGAVVVVAGFVWLATLPAGDAPALDMDAPPPAAPGAEAVPPIDTVPVPVPAAEVTPPAAVETEAAPAPARAEPIRPVTPRVAPAPAPRVAAPTAEPALPPVIETAPLVVAPPTAATPAPTDPDAPIETRPQPLT